jgi:hypothetical protein
VGLRWFSWLAAMRSRKTGWCSRLFELGFRVALAGRANLLGSPGDFRVSSFKFVI